LTLLRKDSFSWNSPQARETYQGILLKHPCFLIEDLAVSDLVRLMHCYLFPKRSSGISQLMEKGSLILGEKLYDLASVGLLID
ncbi:hypothetical protein, partial [Escherichia coli]|uniref:hypothetical protein n=1 Tax=Escherichia coli TaxID=562 RepID=UPI001BDDC111